MYVCSIKLPRPLKVSLKRQSVSFKSTAAHTSAEDLGHSESSRKRLFSQDSDMDAEARYECIHSICYAQIMDHEDCPAQSMDPRFTQQSFIMQGLHFTLCTQREVQSLCLS